METKVIKFSNKKLLLLILGGLIFIILGILFIIIPDAFITFLIKDTLFIQFVGIVDILFFCPILIAIVRKRFIDKNMGIIVNEKGIIDNSSLVSVGLIKWEDIISIEKNNVASANFLFIKIKNPADYINTSIWIKSKLLNANYKSYGTPISISVNLVSCSFSQLEEVIINSFEKYKMNN